MSSWKSIIAGRENDVYFLLKELVEDREIAKAIGDFKGLPGPNKKEEEEDKRSLEERLEDFSKDRAEQRKKLTRAFELSEKAVKENDSKDASEYMKELFVEKEGFTQFDKEIYESIKNLMDTKKYKTNIDVSDRDKEILANYGRQETKDIIEQQISSSLETITQPSEETYSSKLKEAEAKYKNARDNVKKEGKKLDKQIKFMESVLGGKKVQLSEVAEALELPMKTKNVSLEQRRKLQDDIQRRENRLKSIKLRIKNAEEAIESLEDSLDDDDGYYSRPDKKEEYKKKRAELTRGLGKLNREMQKHPKALQKDKKELNALKLESQKRMKLNAIQNEKGFKNELKSLKRKKQGLSSKEEVSKNKLNSILRIASIEVDKEEFRNIFESLEDYGKQAVEGTIKEVQNLSKNELNRKIKDSKLKIIASDKKSALESFDETTELVKLRIENIFSQKERDKLIAAGKEERPQAKESVAFSEIFSEIEGKPALKTIKDLLNTEGFKQYLNVLDSKIIIEGKKIGAYKKMTRKEKNDFVLDNMSKFKEYYTRLMGALDDLQAKTPTEDKKITKIKKLMKSMQSRFKMTKTEKDKRKESPVRFGALKDTDMRTMTERLAAEEKMLYGYFFARARVDSAKKQEALLTSDVSAQTRKFWKDLSSNIDVFSKAASNYQSEDDFVKALQSFIGKNKLHVIDILNLMGTKRNNNIRSDILSNLQGGKFFQDLTRAKKEAPARYGKETLEQKIARQKREGGMPKRYEPKDPRFSEKESMLKAEDKEELSNKESMDKRMLDWGNLTLEESVKAARKIRGAEDSDDFDTSNRRLHTFFTEEKSEEDKNRFFAFVDVNRKAEVVVRGFSYKKGDTGYNEIEKAAGSILKNLEKEVTFEGQEMTILEVINRISRNTFKYKAGRVEDTKKDNVREQFGKLVEEAIKNVKLKKSEQFKIPTFFKTRMEEDSKVFRNDIMNLQPFSPPAIQRNLKPILEEYININEKIVIDAEIKQKLIFDIYEEINSTPKEEPKEKDIDTIAEEMMMQTSIYRRKERQLNKLLDRFDEMEKKIQSSLETKRKFLSQLQERIEKKMEQRELRAQRKIVTALQASEEIIQEEIAELEKGAEYRLLEHLTKFVKFTQKEKAENKRLIESMQSGEGKRTKRGIKVPAKEEDE